LLPATTFLEDQMPGPGPVAGPALDRRQREDAGFGLQIAKEMSRLDIGQSVVVRHGTVLSVEAFEGTNECIKRGGALGRGRALLAKVSKPGQDLRFDVPVIGPETIRTCAAAGVPAVVVEAGCTLILGRDEVEQVCRELRVALAADQAP
jgi:UDP-2,3-diacylglucosamine hydrolase